MKEGKRNGIGGYDGWVIGLRRDWMVGCRFLGIWEDREGVWLEERAGG